VDPAVVFLLTGSNAPGPIYTKDMPIVINQNIYIPLGL